MGSIHLCKANNVKDIRLKPYQPQNLRLLKNRLDLPAKCRKTVVFVRVELLHQALRLIRSVRQDQAFRQGPEGRCRPAVCVSVFIGNNTVDSAPSDLVRPLLEFPDVRRAHLGSVDAF